MRGDDITILIDNSSGVPLYEQIIRQIREQFIDGTLAPGTQLHSIRHLAQQLQVSVITTKRAYEELEREGIIRTIAGKGTFLSDSPPDNAKQSYRAEVLDALKTTARQAKILGMTAAEFTALAKNAYEEEHR
ncbi:GntR family transcriptional regulator [Ruminococcaceae bacterium OttesenSCG-928-L11]|nr:GntR family transcriptional regulator [Ruminococcaceae bacterium OttesenSCG-928-L11]